MSQVIIRVEDLAKQYRLGEIGTGSLVHDINRWMHRISGKEDPYLMIGDENDRTKKGKSQYVWALKHISFDARKGEVLGIIGKNGAGKSTLLKILSRTTSPTKGIIKIRGRVASLLEVGTGFHPDLSGRDNVFLNGAILGMTRQEIKRKFDEIVDFSGVEKYIDTPVKRYSSGMYVRLAFGVAAHLESEILIVDEVLAVGDAEFQKKCLGKMKDVSGKEGRTVLFVSHNMAAVKSLCTHGIVLENGQKKFDGDVISAVNFYQKGNNGNSNFVHEGEFEQAPGNASIRILNFSVSPLRGDFLSITSGMTFELVFFNNRPDINLDITFELKNSDEVVVFHQGTAIANQKDAKTGIYTITGIVKSVFLNAGNYSFNIIFGEDQRYLIHNETDLVHFEIMNESFGSNSNILPGVVRPEIEYAHKFNSNIGYQWKTENPA